VGRGRRPVPSLLAAGRWQDEAALKAALETLRPKPAAIGLRIFRQRPGAAREVLKRPAPPEPRC